MWLDSGTVTLLREHRKAQLGHATAGMTDHYTHVLAADHLAAAEAVARLVTEAGA